MTTSVTNGVVITVNTQLLSKKVATKTESYIFEYEIEILNLNNYKIKLLEREWEINDLVGHKEVVHGFGVIGKQPIIEPFETFKYKSFAETKSGLSTMKGRYFFTIINERNERTTHFYSDIPKFELFCNHKLN